MKREAVKKNKERIKEYERVEYNISEEGLLNYVEKHGSSLDALFKLAYWYRKNGQYDEAIFYLKPLLNTRYNKFVLLELAKIYIMRKQYVESFGCMSILKGLNPSVMDDNGYDSFFFFLASKLNIDLNVNVNSLRYRNAMLYRYSKEQALEHIKEHLNPSITGKRIRENEVYFNKDIDINKLYDEVEKFLENDLIDKSMYSGVIRLNYIYYPNIGDNFRGTMNYLAVSTVVETNNIVTLFPVIKPGGEFWDYNLDLYDYQDLKMKLEDKSLKKHYRQ